MENESERDISRDFSKPFFMFISQNIQSKIEFMKLNPKNFAFCQEFYFLIVQKGKNRTIFDYILVDIFIIAQFFWGSPLTTPIRG